MRILNRWLDRVSKQVSTNIETDKNRCDGVHLGNKNNKLGHKKIPIIADEDFYYERWLLNLIILLCLLLLQKLLGDS